MTLKQAKLGMIGVLAAMAKAGIIAPKAEEITVDKSEVRNIIGKTAIEFSSRCGKGIAISSYVDFDKRACYHVLRAKGSKQATIYKYYASEN